MTPDCFPLRISQDARHSSSRRVLCIYLMSSHGVATKVLFPSTPGRAILQGLAAVVMATAAAEMAAMASVVATNYWPKGRYLFR